MIAKIWKLFVKEEILPQYSVSRKRTDMYLPEHSLEKGHTDRDEKEAKEKEKIAKGQLGCEIIRSNPDAKDFNNFNDEIGKISNYIIESTKKIAEKSTKKSLTENPSGKLSNLKIKSDHLLI